MAVNQIPRNEYPRPQLVRADWQCLNGAWEFCFDPGESGEERKFYLDGPFDRTIIVPFCPESKLSGIGDTDFHDRVWYRRKITVTAEMLANGKRTILHIGASDYLTKLWVNGVYVGDHRGGYVSFSFDITDQLTVGENTIVISAIDHLRDGTQPAGKQCKRYHSYGCFYTRTTGIWQTVWLETVPQAYIANTRITSNIADKTVNIVIKCENAEGMQVKAVASYKGKRMGESVATVCGNLATLQISLAELHLWEIGQGRLYDLSITLGEDQIASYFGMRSVHTRDGVLYLNGKPVFQRLVLDQGFYPDGIYTAPNDAELVADITRSTDLGFHGARLHQKVFEPRFLYHADRLGYIVWGEHGNWGLELNRPEAWANFIPEWMEIMERDFNHPAIIGWCPLNETKPDQDPRFLRAVADATRRFDPTRAYIDTSGWMHEDSVLTDFMDLHDYEQDPEKFRATYAPLADGEMVNIPRKKEKVYATFVSEYGGIQFTDSDGWGYGNAPRDMDEFLSRFAGLAAAILENPAMAGLCYTQLTDVEQEQNGLYTYDRVLKFPREAIYAALTGPSAMEARLAKKED